MNFELRVAGPDTIDVMTDELEALRWANAINKQYLADRAMHPDNEVLCVATVYAVDIGENLPEVPTCTKSQTCIDDEKMRDITSVLIEGLNTDGSGHKQLALEQALEMLVPDEFVECKASWQWDSGR